MLIFDILKRLFKKDVYNNLDISHTEFKFLLTNINPKLFKNIHSSNFNIYRVRTYANNLDDYNNLLNKIITSYETNKLPNIGEFETNDVSLPEFFTKKGKYINEINLMKTFINFNDIISDWMSLKEQEDSYESQTLYMLSRRVYVASLNLTNLFIEVQKELKHG